MKKIVSALIVCLCFFTLLLVSVPSAQAQGSVSSSFISTSVDGTNYVSMGQDFQNPFSSPTKIDLAKNQTIYFRTELVVQNGTMSTYFVDFTNKDSQGNSWFDFTSYPVLSTGEGKITYTTDGINYTEQKPSLSALVGYKLEMTKPISHPDDADNRISEFVSSVTMTPKKEEILQNGGLNQRIHPFSGGYDISYGLFPWQANRYVMFTNEIKSAAPITIEYVDEDGDRIHESQTISGNVGDAYNTATDAYRLKIDGYSLDQDKLPLNEVGTFTTAPQTITYTYQRNKTVLDAHDSTIYVGDGWNAGDNFDGGTDPYERSITINDVQINGSVDTAKVGKYEITYSYDRVPNKSWTGDHATAKATVTVIDKKEAKPVTVTYVDTTGKEIHEKKIVKGELGAAFDVSGKEYQPAIKGYILDDKQLPKNAKGTFSDQAQTVVYVYQPEMKPTTDTSDSSSSDTTTTDTVSSSQSTDQSSDSSKDSGKAVPAGSSNSYHRQTAVARNTSAKLLPKTGETTTPSYLIAGISVLIFAIGLLLFSRKKAKQ